MVNSPRFKVSWFRVQRFRSSETFDFGLQISDCGLKVKITKKLGIQELKDFKTLNL
jgi:hypothetical protein